MLKNNKTILFQGDSITDAGRTYVSDCLGEGSRGLSCFAGLGNGYPLMVAQYLDNFFNDKNIKVLNRGISGDRTTELLARWDKDCIDLKPDYLSILIGINDTWRRYDSNNPMTTEQYEKNYRLLLDRAINEIGCEIIMLEPFLQPVDPAKSNWRKEDLSEKIAVVRELAIEYKATFIPLDGILFAAAKDSSPQELTSDGVHPKVLGHSVIARAWLKAMGMM